MCESYPRQYVNEMSRIDNHVRLTAFFQDNLCKLAPER